MNNKRPFLVTYNPATTIEINVVIIIANKKGVTDMGKKSREESISIKPYETENVAVVKF